MAELQTSFEERWKRVCEQNKNDILFLRLQEYVFGATREKYTFLQDVHNMIPNAMMYVQQGKNVEDLYLDNSPQ